MMPPLILAHGDLLSVGLFVALFGTPWLLGALAVALGLSRRSTGAWLCGCLAAGLNLWALHLADTLARWSDPATWISRVPLVLGATGMALAILRRRKSKA
jgi:hypothetical protein